MTKTLIIPAKSIQKIRHPVPKIWHETAGLLQGKGKQMLHHVQKLRKEWGRKTNHK